MQKCYDGIEIASNTDMIRKICKSLRKYQRFYESQSEKDKQPVQYYKGNISTVDIQTLDPKEWLNDQIMNRYLVWDLISSTLSRDSPLNQSPLSIALSSVQIHIKN